MNEYTIPKPTYPIAAKVLTGAVLIALLGLCVVAFEAFRLIDNPLVAGAFALVIELGAVSEALSILKRNRPAVAGLVVSLIVSAIYNFTHAQQKAAGLVTPLGDVQLWALAIGPLSAALFLSLSLAYEIKQHEQAVAKWTADRQSWLDDRAVADRLEQEKREDRERQDRERQEEIARQERERKAQLESDERKRQAEISAQLELQRERIRLEAEQKNRLAEIEAQERESRRAASLKRREISLQEAEEARKITESAVKPPETVVKLQKGTYEDFRSAMQSNGTHKYTAAEIAERWNVSERTGFTWLKRYQEEHPETIAVEVN